MIRIIPQPETVIEKNGVCQSEDNISFVADSHIVSEGYRAVISPDGVKIYASDERGFFYGKMTLEQLKIQSGGTLPCAEISDRPEYAYRGFMLDSARHMISVSEIKKMIDAAAMLKLNKFHWHLSDDQGFRIELDSFPELTEKGSVRKGDNFGSICRSDKEYSGYYTKAEIREIIAYCREKFIDVIPEIDMPGHTSAILHVYPNLSCRKEPVEVKNRQGIYKDNLCMGNPETLGFIKTLLDELCELFDSEYFHIGGDEAPDEYRKTCPDCQKMIKENNLESTAALQCFFAEQVKTYLETKGRKAIVWNDILKGGMVDKSITVQRWMDAKNNAFKAANSGNKVIVSDFRPYYFDYPYGMYPLKNVYRHNPVKNKALTPEGVKNIIGVEAPLWTEFVDNPERLEYLCFPRWLAFAETAWSAPHNKNYAQFKSVALTLCDKMKMDGYNCADKNDMDMPLHKRLSDVIKFFSAFLSK